MLPPQNPEAEMSTRAPSSLLAGALKGLTCKRLQWIHENGIPDSVKRVCRPPTLAVLGHTTLDIFIIFVLL